MERNKNISIKKLYKYSISINYKYINILYILISYKHSNIHSEINQIKLIYLLNRFIKYISILNKYYALFEIIYISTK